MKRWNADVAGQPSLRDPRRDVAGAVAGSRAASPSLLEVASFRHALDDPMGIVASDADLLADFADFMAGAREILCGDLPAPDPVFRERLRRQLWRTHVMTRLRDGGETH